MKLYTSKIGKKTIKNNQFQDIEIQSPLVDLDLYEMIENKKYFYALEIPRDCEEVVDFMGREEEFLKVFKDRGLYELNRDFKERLKPYLDSYIPEVEMISWAMQEAEAKLYDPSLSRDELFSQLPLISNLCFYRYGSLENLPTLVSKILEKSKSYSTLSGILIGQKQAIADKIEGCKSMIELMSALDLQIEIKQWK
ncbi:hypothetical protein [Helicobacter sp. 13S00477-4]|uniref:hypothetical protein n=1 Tax=Helicobacter sp. 13S00477-4 TaxID=1905759 RepID=UPI000BA6A9E2|nr:hypothetical protein [Helicobacter sp. 13S00477-4]PAF51997.1 hypothetical protein BKH44_04875 [Helicobacter sp. 13S00477-4]